MWREGTGSTFEEEVKCVRFRRILEPTEDNGEDPARGRKPSERTRKARLLQFYDENGRLRTWDIDDVVDIR